jgi:hypothetical protein
MGGPNLLLGIKARSPSTPLVATRAEIWTGEQAGVNTIGLWSHDAANNQPRASLGSASWSMSRINGWQGATFAAPIVILPNTDFWLVWAPINGAQASIQINVYPGGPTYRGSFNGGQSWNGPFNDILWKLRIHCGGSPGHYEVYGANCAGATRRRPELGFFDVPTIGRSTVLALTQGTPSGNAFLAIGGSDASWGAIPLPLDLTPFGAATCRLLCSLDLAVPTPLDVNGQANLPLSIPGDPSLVGRAFFNQWLVVDPAANALQMLLSNGGKARIGN